MIVVRLAGGLGNQMFQYAAGLSLARRNGDTLFLDTTGFPGQSERRETERPYALSDFEISAEVLADSEARRVRNPYGPISRGMRFLKRQGLRKFYHDWHPEIFDWKGDVYLDGYFQSSRYFSDIDGVIRREFALKEQYLAGLADVRAEIFGGDRVPVSLHVRRGDYVNNPKNAPLFDVCTVDYFQRAVAYVGERLDNMKLVVFSDDVDWVRQNLPFTSDALFVSGRRGIDGNALRPSQEMALMSHCRHNIISNSTFSWWGAYLNSQPDRIVVAPEKWNNSREFTHRNIIPDGWVTQKI